MVGQDDSSPCYVKTQSQLQTSNDKTRDNGSNQAKIK